jgi:hypothetical protein
MALCRAAFRRVVISGAWGKFAINAHVVVLGEIFICYGSDSEMPPPPLKS